MRFIKTLSVALLATLTITFAYAQSSANHFVYLKNPAGLLVGVIVHQDTFVGNIKIHSYCAFQKLTSGVTCEQVDPSSPFATDPNKAIRFVNKDPNVTPQIFQQIQADLGSVTAKLAELTNPAPAPRPNSFSDVGNAAVPSQLEGSDTTIVARTNSSVVADQAVPAQPSTPAPAAPQFNTVPGITMADVSAAIARALAGYVAPTTIITQPALVTPSQVISSFFSGTGGGSANYIGYGAGEISNPNTDGNLKSLNLGTGGLNSPIALIASSSIGQLNASVAAIASSSVTNLTTTNLIGAGATFTNLYVNGVFNTASGTFSVVATNSSFAILSASTTNASTSNADNLIVTNGTITNSSSTNFFTSFANILSGIFGSIVGDSIQVRTITATSSAYALNAFASTSNASTSNAENLAVSGSSTLASTTLANVTGQNAAFTSITGGNANITGSSTLASTTVSNLTSTGNVAGQAFVGGTGSFTNLTSSGSTTLGSTTASNLTSTGNLSGANLAVSGSSTLGSTTLSNITVQGNAAVTGGLSAASSTISGTAAAGNLSVTGSSTIGSTTASNLSVTGSLAAALFNAITAVFGTITSTIGNIATLNGGTGNFTDLNATGSSQLTTVYASTSNASTSNVANLSAGNATLSNATVTNSFATTQYVTNASVTNLTVGGNNVTNVISQINTTLNTQTVNSSTTNSSTTNTTNLNTSNATITNATSTNFAATNLTTSGSSTLGSTTVSNITSTGNVAGQAFVGNTGSFTNLTSTGSTTLGSTTASNVSVTGNLSGNNIFTNALSAVLASITTLWGGTSNFQTANASTTNASTTNTNALIAGNGTLTNATSTNFFASALSALSATLSNLIAGTATLGSVQVGTLDASSSLYALSSYASSTYASTSNAINLIATNATLTNATVSALSASSLYLTVAPNGWLYTDSIGQIRASSSPTVSYITATTSTSTFLGIEVGGSIVPLTDNTLSLGSPSKRFKDLYVASSTIYIDNIGLSNNNGALTWAGSGIVATAGQSLLASTTITNATVTSTLYITPFNSVGGLVFATTSGKLAQTNALAYDQSANKLILTGGLTAGATTTLTNLDMNSTRITNLAVPVATTDAVNKAYVDSAFASGVLWQAPVKSLGTTTAPVSPASGDRYVLLAGQAGYGSCANNDIAEWSGAAWVCTTPATGTTVFVDSYINQQYNFNGSSWNSIATAIDHNNLFNLQGGQAGEYYHLKASDYSALTAGTAQLLNLRTVGNPTFNSITITSGLNSATSSFTNATATTFAATNFTTSGSSTLASTTVSNLTSTGNVAGQAFVGGTGSFTNLTSSGSTTLGSTTAANLTVTGNFAAAVFSAASAFFSTLTATIANIATLNGGTANFTNVNATGTSQLTTVYASTTNASTTNSQNLIVSGSSTLASTTLTNVTVQGSAAVTGGLSTASSTISGTETAANLRVTGSSTLASTTVTNITSTGNVAGQAFVGGTGSFTNLTSSGSTTLGSTTASNLTSTGNLSGANLAVSGSSTIGSTTASNLTVTGNFATAVFNAVSAVFSSIFATTGNFTTLNATTSNASTSNITNLVTTGSSTLGSTTASNVSVTGNLAAAILNAVSAVIGTLTASVGNIATLNTGTFNVTNINATGTSQIATLLASTTSASSSSIGNATITNATITGSIAFGAGSSITATGGTSTFATSSIASATITYALNVPGTATLATATISSSTISKLNSQGAVLGVATVTSATATNLFATNASMSAATATNLYANNASLSAVTTNSLFAAAFQALSANFSSLFSPTIYVTNFYASTTNASTTNTITLNATGTSTLATTTINNALGIATSTNIYGGALTTGATLNGGLVLSSTTPATTTYALYNNAGTLYWNGTAVGSGSSSTGTSTLGLLVYSAGTQSIPNVTLTIVTDLTNVTRDDFGGGALSGGAFTVPNGKDGWYQIAWNVRNAQAGSLNASAYCAAGIYLNGVAASFQHQYGSAGTCQTSINKYLTAGDVITFRTQHAQGAAVTMNTLANASIVRINADSIWTSSGQNTYFNGGLVSIGTSTISNTNLTVQATSSASAIANFLTYTGTSTLFLSSAGNVGIGTTSPSDALSVIKKIGVYGFNGNAANVALFDEVGNDAFSMIKRLTTGAGNLSLGVGSVEINASSSNGFGIINRAPSGYLAFGTGGNGAGSERMRISSTGNIGIGTTTPTNTLSLYGANNGPQLTIASNQNNSGILISAQAGTPKSFSMVVTGSLASNPSAFQIIDESAGSLTRFRIGGAGTITFGAYGAGTLTTDASGIITASSDERLKDIQGFYTALGTTTSTSTGLISTSTALDKIMGLNPIIYKWNATSGMETAHTYVGFSAQNVQANIPEAVGTDPRGYLTLSDRPILATLVDAFKEIVGISGTFKTNLVAWLGETGNGIANIVTDQLHTRLLCIGRVCFNEAQATQLESLIGGASTGGTLAPTISGDAGTWGGGTVLGTSTQATSTDVTTGSSTTTDPTSGSTPSSGSTPDSNSPSPSTDTPANDDQPAANDNTSASAPVTSDAPPAATGTDGQ